MKIPFRLLWALAICGSAWAQVPKSKPPAAATSPAVIDETIYPLPLEERDKIRDAQHEIDQIEIENQKMLLKVEQNKSRQASVMERIQIVAWQFAQAKHIDLVQYELDPAEIKFVRKKAK